MHAHTLPAHRFVFILGFVEGRAQGQQQTFARQLQEIEAGPAGGRFQKRASIAAELQDVQLGIDEDAGRNETFERDAVSLALGAGFDGPTYRPPPGSLLGQESIRVE